jgi:hypothetical protein
MSKIDLTKLLSDMLNAAKGELGEKWPIAKDYAETEFKKIGEQILLIEKRKLTGEITEEEAKLLLHMQANASKAVLLAIEGIGLLTAEAAINAVLKVIKDAVNAAIGMAVI